MEQKERNELFLFDNELTPAKKTLWDLPFNYTNSDLVIIPVPWEVTVSFRTGTAKAPEAVLEASLHVDLYDDLYVFHSFYNCIKCMLIIHILQGFFYFHFRL